MAFCPNGGNVPEDEFDAAAVALLASLTKFLKVYRAAKKSDRRAPLLLIQCGLEEVREGVLEEFKVPPVGPKNGGDTG